MNVLFIWILWVCVLGLVAVFGGLYLALLLLYAATNWARSREIRPADGALPGLTVYLSALNEEDAIEGRLSNIVECVYPRELLEILVFSDGSRDRTAEVARTFASRGDGLRSVRVVEWPENQGKFAAQNAAAGLACFDVLVSTDAESRFERGFLRAIGEAMRAGDVGVVGGELQARVGEEGRSPIARLIAEYRRLENRLRALESDLGVLAKTDASCVAYRKQIWSEIEEFEDLDQVVLFMARASGFRALHSREAVCTELPHTRMAQEFRRRARMTRKALLSTRKRWPLGTALTYPMFSVVYFAHKLLRYFSPFLWVGALVSTTALARSYASMQVCAWLMWGLVGAAVIELASRKLAGRGIGLGLPAAFFVSNAGFAWGVLGWVAGDRSGRHRPTRHQQ